MTASMTGRTLSNRYLITERIGIGGMAEVYRAQDNVLGRLVAIKTMLPQYAADSNFTQRFRQEAAAAANLQSPYIVNVYDWGQDDGTYYIVMEFVRGSDLKSAIKQRGAINQRKVAEIGAQVCQALSVAHNQDIIHRDIKPQNIMVQPDGNVKVMDFGIARAKNSVMQHTSAVLGTAHYISPEQAQGKELTSASDIYSLGVVLFEAATGELPFDGPDAVNVAMQQVQDLPPLPSEIKPDIDPTLEAIILKAMEKNPADRFATASEMRSALNNFLAGRPVNLEGFGAARTAILGGAMGAGAVGSAAAATAVLGGSSADATQVMPGAAMGGAGSVGGATQVMPGGYTPTSANGKGGHGGKNGKSSHYQGGSSGPEKKPIAIIAVAAIAALALIGGIVFFLMNGQTGEPVPNVEGMAYETAEQTLVEAGFEVGTVDGKFDESVEEGHVISQDPPAETKRPLGSKINLVISQGTQELVVPDLENMTADEARQALAAKGLNYEAGPAEYSDEIEKDKVCRQSPAAGETIEAGATVTYYLSLGVEPVEVPSVIGYSEGDATSILNDAGFKVSVEYTSSDESKGTVVGQTPNGGMLEKGESVTITVSEGPAGVKVPNVVGKSENAALTAITNAGLTMTVDYESSDTVAAGKVISQDPSSGRLEKGDYVYVVISTGPAASEPAAKEQ